MAVHPDRSYTRRGQTRTLGDAVFVDLGQGKNLVALLAHLDNRLVLDDMNYVALRAYAGGHRQARAVQRNEPVDRHSAGEGRTDPGARQPLPIRPRPVPRGWCGRTMPKRCSERAIGSQGISVEVVPNGYWPLDFGGALGRAGHARDPGEIAVARALQAIRRPRRSARPVCPGSRRSTLPGGFHAKIAGQLR